jgi:hypothetical protein
MLKKNKGGLYLEPFAVSGVKMTGVVKVEERSTDHQIPHYCGHICHSIITHHMSMHNNTSHVIP